jgi:tRNA(adenine34) deaminase
MYAELDPIWAQAVDQAWESFGAGSIGIGAVVTDESGTVVAVGRNRAGEDSGPAGRLYGTRMAHAEVDVLSSLAAPRREGLTVWSTLQPCAFCSAAMVLMKVSQVRFAARDPLWDGVERLPELNPFVASRWPGRTGPEPGEVAVFGGLLPLAWVLREFGVDTAVGRVYAVEDPDLLAHATAVLDSGDLAELTRTATAREAFDRLAGAAPAVVPGF